MRRPFAFSLVALALVVSPAPGQDGPLRRAGRNIRSRVEAEVATAQLNAQERDLLNRVTRRLEWDKQLLGSALQLEVRPDGSVVLRGSVASDALKRRAVDLVENTIGVTAVVDATAVVKEVKVIESKPAARVIDVVPPVTTPAETTVVVPPAPSETKIIVKP